MLVRSFKLLYMRMYSLIVSQQTMYVYIHTGLMSERRAALL